MRRSYAYVPAFEFQPADSRTANGRIVTVTVADRLRDSHPRPIPGNRTSHIAYRSRVLPQVPSASLKATRLRASGRSLSPTRPSESPFLCSQTNSHSRIRTRTASESEDEAADLAYSVSSLGSSNPRHYRNTTAPALVTDTPALVNTRTLDAAKPPSSDPSYREVQQYCDVPLHNLPAVSPRAKLRIPSYLSLPVPGSPLRPTVVARAARARCHADRTNVHIGCFALRHARPAAPVEYLPVHNSNAQRKQSSGTQGTPRPSARPRPRPSEPCTLFEHGRA
ncbi:hypothetical protein C8T65DRAFT_60374 [Cerioporus squamosus]|nr:hypothetical protein C8T65DRAFT_60374 [Cerioporus squamosus]